MAQLLLILELMAVTRVVNTAGQTIEYERRRPEESVFYKIVQEHIGTLFTQAAAQSEHGFGYPAQVKREFERFLTCGILAAGFARIQCERKGCAFERLVAYSCKGRCICPSCVSRRMADCAAHLVENVLPLAPYRQWTLSLPYTVRLRIGYDKALLSQVLAIFLRTVFSWQRLQARRLGIHRPLVGAVTLCQRYGSLLQFSPHFHSWLPDGVFALDGAGSLQFHPLAPPEDSDLDRLLWRIAHRVSVLLDKTQDDVPTDDEAQALQADQAAALTPPLLTPTPSPVPSRGPRCSWHEWYSLHADLQVDQDDRRKLERLLRYGLRPPFAKKRLSLTSLGQVRLKLRKPYFTGQTEIVLPPLDFLRRLAATIPPRRMNMVRFHGVFAPHAMHRQALRTLLPAPPGTPQERQVDPRCSPRATGACYRRPWHELLKRVFDLDILICGKCGSKMHRISHIEDPSVVAQILGHLNLPTTPPPISPARAPPQMELDFCDEESVFDDVA